MKELDQKIFEELISDNYFISWARGDDVLNADFWNSWEESHPLNVHEFRDAVRLARELRFRGGDVQEADIQYLWAKTSERISQARPTSGIHYFISQVTKIAAILVIPMLVVSTWLFYNQKHLTQKYSDLLANKHEQKITVVAPIGSRITLDLPDGSTVWLNSGSKITYPVVFNTQERRVSLIGEAYFKVRKDQVPFYVSNLGPEIKDYGTEFNVNSYNDEDQVTVALTEGRISFKLNCKEEFLVPGQVSVFDKTKKRVKIENTDVAIYGTWREGKYILRDTPLSAILRILQRQHNVDIRLLDPELGNYRYNATINNESLEQILKLLTLSAPIKYSYKHRMWKSDGTWERDEVEISADKTRIVKSKI